MKKIFSILFTTAIMALVLAGCHKVDDLPYYGNGTAPTLSASETDIAPLPADSNNTVLTLSWTYPNYATDSGNIKYVIEIDSAGKNFSNPLVREVVGETSTDFLAKEINNFLVGRDYAFNVPVTLEARITSSYANNNEKLAGNTVTFKFTPYKVPPRVALPQSGHLYITGGDFGWNNSNPMPAYQELTRISETMWGGIFEFTGGQSYLLLPDAGSWDQKYGGLGANNTNNTNGDSFKPGGGDLMSPAAGGTYKLTVDFQTGKFTVTPYDGTLPEDNLYIVGGATAGDWSNPVPVPSQQFTRVSNALWKITLPMNGGSEFLVLPSNGDWSKKYALKDNSVPGIEKGGEFGFHQDGQPAPDDFTKNFKGPATSGTYTVSLNFAAPTTIDGASGTFTISQ
jgi:hypothetical protein